MLMNENRHCGGVLDLPSLMTELQLRGFDQDKVDSALRCLVHVYAVQDHTSKGGGGMLVEDVVNTYPIEIVQAASEVFLDKLKAGGLEVYRVKWGFEDTAKMMEKQLWDLASAHWNEFVAGADERYLGFFLPDTEEGSRIITTWKVRKDLKWFSVEIPQRGWNVLRLIDDVISVAWKLDLAFGFRPFDGEGVQGERVLLHSEAYASLKERAVPPSEDLVNGIRLWRFFSEYDVNTTDFVALMKECGLSLDQVVGQVKAFFQDGLTSQYRDGQYPPYFVNDKKKKEFQLAVRALLDPMDAWLSRRSEVSETVQPTPAGEAGRKSVALGYPLREVLLVRRPRSFVTP
jgi:hypothetical protein